MAKLTSGARSKLKLSDFAEPSARKYPIPDISHARNALSRVAANGTSGEKAAIKRAVRGRFPSVK